MSEQDDITDGTTDDAGTDRVDDTEGADSLRDAGKKALDAMKGKWQTERDARKERDAEIARLKAEIAGRTADLAKKDDQPDLAKLREQAKAEAAAEVLRDRALDKIETKAAKLFADPEDARALLAASVDDFIDGGKLDVDAIEAALTELLAKKPHLAAQGGRRFEGSADGGARNGKTKPSQLSRDDMKRMSPREIVKARSEGRLDDLLSGK